MHDKNTNPCLTAALDYASHKQHPLYVFPCPPGEKKSYYSKKFDPDDKGWGATTDPNRINKYWKDRPTANVCIVTGLVNGLFVIETDTREGHPDLTVEGEVSLKDLIALNGGEWPDTYCVRSPTGSLHRYFTYPDGDNITIPTRPLKNVIGIDVKGDGGMVLAVPSIRSLDDPRRYERISPDGQGIVQAPQWLIKLIVEKRVERQPGEPQAPIGKLAAAMALIPNTPKHVWEIEDETGEITERKEWDGWNDIMMALYRATGGSHEGFKIANDWCSKNTIKYNKKYTEYSWYDRYVKTPPKTIGAGTLFALADYVQPGWQAIWNEDNPDELAAWDAEHPEETGNDESAVEAAIHEGVRVAVETNGDTEPKPATDTEDVKPDAATTDNNNSKNKTDNNDKTTEKPKSAARIIKATPFKWIDPTKIRLRQWLYKPHYIRKFLSATVATGALGKSSLAIVEALAMVTGMDLLGVSTDGVQYRVWYWNGEDPFEELQRRFAAACKHFGITPEDIGDRLFVDNGRTMPIVFAKQGKYGTKIATPTIEGVVTTLVENKIDVMIVDPFVSCHQVMENDNSAIDLVAKSWSGIAEATNSAIMINHHTRKPIAGGNGGSTVDDSRGATALMNAARPKRALNNMTEKEAEQAGIDEKYRRYYFRADSSRSNLSPPAENADWFKLVSVDLGNNDPGIPGDEVGVVTAWEYSTNKEPVSVANIKRAQDTIAASGSWRRDQRTKERWVGVPIAQAFPKKNLTNKNDKQWIEQHIVQWLASGLLAIDKRPDPTVSHRDPVEFVIVGRAPGGADAEGWLKTEPATEPTV